MVLRGFAHAAALAIGIRRYAVRARLSAIRLADLILQIHR